MHGTFPAENDWHHHVAYCGNLNATISTILDMIGLIRRTLFDIEKRCIVSGIANNSADRIWSPQIGITDEGPFNCVSSLDPCEYLVCMIPSYP